MSERPEIERTLDSNTFKSFYYLKEELILFCRKERLQISIDKQFEYNTYILDFHAANEGKFLDDSIRCWKYKKSLLGHNKYEKEDLKVIGVNLDD